MKNKKAGEQIGEPAGREMSNQATRPDSFDLFSPTDFRYSVKELLPYLSEEASISYQCKVEAALARQLAKSGVCSDAIASEIEEASKKIRARDVYEEEKRIKHETRALVNVIRNKVSDSAKPFVHLAATSFDIIDTANALRYRDALLRVVIPDLLTLERHLIGLSRKYADVPQIGRTHGQHAEPITFGFFIALYVSRLGERILALKEATRNLRGKFSGAVGVYGPLSLIVNDPERFESELLRSLGLEPFEISTQIAQPEPLVDLGHAIVSAMGVLANLSRDLRNLQRTEISEVSEEFSSEQVGSSTMPQKRNPVNFENVESLWKKSLPQMITLYLDQVSEHQRDLTNSASERYFPELIVIFDSVVRRLCRALWSDQTKSFRLVIDRTQIERNLARSSKLIAAEPLYILLSLAGYPDAHELLRRAAQSIRSGEKEEEEIDLIEAVRSKDPSSEKYLRSIPSEKLQFVRNPTLYTGIASKKVDEVVKHWEKILESQ